MNVIYYALDVDVRPHFLQVDEVNVNSQEAQCVKNSDRAGKNKTAWIISLVLRCLQNKTHAFTFMTLSFVLLPHPSYQVSTFYLLQ